VKRDGLGLKFKPPTARPPLTHTLCARNKRGDDNMKLKVIIFTQLKKGDIGLRFPSIPGCCATQGETFDELLSNIYEAVEGCLSIDMKNIRTTGKDKVLEIAA